MPAPLLIILPRGLGVSGVTTWALRLGGGLAARGRRIGILAPRGPHDPDMPAGVEAFLCEGLPIDSLAGDLSAILPHCGAAIDAMAGRPLIVSPNLHGDCYGAAVELARTREDIRIVGWQHSDIAYDTHILRWYSPAITRFIAVSARTSDRLRAAIPDRAADIDRIPYGVPVPEAPPRRAALRSRPVRLLYAGRLDHEQKRTGALAPMMDALGAAGVAAELTIAGDGPARAEIESAARARSDIRLLGPQPPARIGALLDEADLFVLPSRYEGLSVAMLEAMARACPPILARVDSGLEDAVRGGDSGIIADVGPDAGADETGAAMAHAVVRAMTSGLDRLGAGAHRAASAFSLDRHLDRVETMLDAAAAAPPPVWPADRPAAFSAWDPRYGSGSVPPDGPMRLARALDALAITGARIAIHGAGEHTRQLADIIEQRLGRVACFCDDNPAAWGGTLLGRPIVAPGAAAGHGATHALISSWLHEEDIWRRRGSYERQGLEVLRLYEPHSTPDGAPLPAHRTVQT